MSLTSRSSVIDVVQHLKLRNWEFKRENSLFEGGIREFGCFHLIYVEEAAEFLQKLSANESREVDSKIRRRATIHTTF